MIYIQEAILVEGKYDKNTLSQLVSTAIFETNGFGIMNDHEKLKFLCTVARKRGLILMTDSDGAGLVIRNYLKSRLPKECLLQAYIPDIHGKEKRKKHPGKAGLLGVEGMTPEVLLQALRGCGAHILGEAPVSPAGGITSAKLYQLGLSGTPDSAARRAMVKKHFALPANLGSKAFLEALNILTTPAELESFLEPKENQSEAFPYSE